MKGHGNARREDLAAPVGSELDAAKKKNLELWARRALAVRGRRSLYVAPPR
jgi:hypothetical protein